MLPPFGLGGAHAASQTGGLMLPNFGFSTPLNGASSINHQINSQVAHLHYLQQ
jgi:hypothetical protein